MKALKIIGGLLIVISIIILSVKIYKNNHPKQKESPAVKTENENRVKKTTELSDYYNEYHLLKKGQVVKVEIPAGYDCNYYGGGKKYYHQAQNGKREIWGGNNHTSTNKPKLGSQNTSYADISYYDEEITVRCEFIKIK